MVSSFLVVSSFPGVFNKKISDWINKNKPKGEFKIKTSEIKTFVKDGNEIKFIDVICKV